MLDSAICEHLNALNSCVVNYSYECFVVLQRAQTKRHLFVLEVIHILFKSPSVCKQNPKHSRNLIGDISYLTSSAFKIPPRLLYGYHFFFFTPPFIYIVFKRLSKAVALQNSDERGPCGFNKFSSYCKSPIFPYVFRYLPYISSSYRAGSTDIPDPLSPLLPIVHRPR